MLHNLAQNSLKKMFNWNQKIFMLYESCYKAQQVIATNSFYL